MISVFPWCWSRTSMENIHEPLLPTSEEVSSKSKKILKKNQPKKSITKNCRPGEQARSWDAISFLLNLNTIPSEEANQEPKNHMWYVVWDPSLVTQLTLNIMKRGEKNKPSSGSFGLNIIIDMNWTRWWWKTSIYFFLTGNEKQHNYVGNGIIIQAHTHTHSHRAKQTKRNNLKATTHHVEEEFNWSESSSSLFLQALVGARRKQLLTKCGNVAFFLISFQVIWLLFCVLSLSPSLSLAAAAVRLCMVGMCGVVLCIFKPCCLFHCCFSVDERAFFSSNWKCDNRAFRFLAGYESDRDSTSSLVFINGQTNFCIYFGSQKIYMTKQKI